MLAVSCPAALVFAAVSPSFFARRGAHTKKIKLQNIYALDEIVRADTVFLIKQVRSLMANCGYPAFIRPKKFLSANYWKRLPPLNNWWTVRLPMP